MDPSNITWIAPGAWKSFIYRHEVGVVIVMEASNRLHLESVDPVYPFAPLLPSNKAFGDDSSQVQCHVSTFNSINARFSTQSKTSVSPHAAFRLLSRWLLAVIGTEFAVPSKFSRQTCIIANTGVPSVALSSRTESTTDGDCQSRDRWSVQNCGASTLHLHLHLFTCSTSNLERHSQYPCCRLRF
jgi:hypothetical protein